MTSQLSQGRQRTFNDCWLCRLLVCGMTVTCHPPDCVLLYPCLVILLIVHCYTHVLPFSWLCNAMPLSCHPPDYECYAPVLPSSWLWMLYPCFAILLIVHCYAPVSSSWLCNVMSWSSHPSDCVLLCPCHHPSDCALVCPCHHPSDCALLCPSSSFWLCPAMPLSSFWLCTAMPHLTIHLTMHYYAYLTILLTVPWYAPVFPMSCLYQCSSVSYCDKVWASI